MESLPTIEGKIIVDKAFVFSCVCARLLVIHSTC